MPRPGEDRDSEPGQRRGRRLSGPGSCGLPFCGCYATATSLGGWVVGWLGGIGWDWGVGGIPQTRSNATSCGGQLSLLRDQGLRRAHQPPRFSQLGDVAAAASPRGLMKIFIVAVGTPKQGQGLFGVQATASKASPSVLPPDFWPT